MLELTLATTLIATLLLCLFQRRHQHHHDSPTKSNISHAQRRRARGRRAILEAQDRIGAHRTCLATPTVEIDQTRRRNVTNNVRQSIHFTVTPPQPRRQPNRHLRIITQYNATPAAGC